MNIYVCSPSAPLSIGNYNIKKGVENIQKLGHTVTFSEHSMGYNGNTSGTIRQRVDDIHEGFQNDKYDIVMASIGGWNSNELLPHLDYKLISEHPKKLVGMSDITTLCVNLWEKSKIETLYGLQFRHFTSDGDFDQFNSIIQDPASFSGFFRSGITDIDILRKGKMKGRLVGGNLALLCWLLGTPYALNVEDGDILFIEDDAETNGYYWQMYFNHIKQAGYLEKISGLVVGKVLKETRFQKKSNFKTILSKVVEEYNFPVLTNADFGHIDNPLTIPYGLNYSLDV